MASELLNRQLLGFFLLVVALEIGTLLAGLGRDTTPFVLVLIPPAAALLVTGVSGGQGDVKSLLGRLGRWRVGARWYVAAVGIPLAEKLAVVLLGLALGVSSLDRVVNALTASALVVPLVVLLPALLEELGWRGFGVQTAVDAGHSPAWAAAIVGPMFVAAHVPLYLPGQLYEGLPVWPLPISLLAGAVLLTWVYLRTGGSVLVAGLMHGALNATVPLTWGLDDAWVWQARAGVIGVIAVLVVVMSGVKWWRSSYRARVSGGPPSVDPVHGEPTVH
jgi:hypothetical protein